MASTQKPKEEKPQQESAQNIPATTNQNAPELPQTPAMKASPSERFTQAIEREFMQANGFIALTQFQKKLIKNYFIKIDLSLKLSQQKNKNKQFDKPDPELCWANINMGKLATDVITFSAVGLDPLQPNHVNFIPFLNTSQQKYDLVPIMGYRGLELKSKKYGLEVPDEITIELIFSKDKFTPIKRDINHTIEGYIFEQSTDLDRGDIVGGFYYYDYFADQRKNKLETFSKKEIDKRKPKHASVEFWGGEKNIWQNNQVVGKETVEGWYEDMAWKTIARAAYNNITIDSEKIDEHFLTIAAREQELREQIILNERDENANKKEIGLPNGMSPGHANSDNKKLDAASSSPDYSDDGNRQNINNQQTPAPEQKTTPPAADQQQQERKESVPQEFGPGF